MGKADAAGATTGVPGSGPRFGRGRGGVARECRIHRLAVRVREQGRFHRKSLRHGRAVHRGGFPGDVMVHRDHGMTRAPNRQELVPDGEGVNGGHVFGLGAGRERDLLS